MVSADRQVTLVIPPGALEKPTVIQIVPTEPPPPAAEIVPAGPFYRFLPDGLDFLVPASVTLPYDPRLATGSDPILRVAKVLDDGFEIDEHASVDVARYRVTADLRGFSAHGSVRSVRVPCPQTCGSPTEIEAEYFQSPYRHIHISWRNGFGVGPQHYLIERARKARCAFSVDAGNGLPSCLPVRDSEYQEWVHVSSYAEFYDDAIDDDSALYFYRSRVVETGSDRRRVLSEPTRAVQVFVAGVSSAASPDAGVPIVSDGGPRADGGARSTLDASSRGHQLTVEIIGRGAVHSSPAGIDCENLCTAHFPAAQRVRLQAAFRGDTRPAVHWAGDCFAISELTADVVMDGDKTCTVTFDDG